MRRKRSMLITAIASVSALTIPVRLSQAPQTTQPHRYYVFNLGEPGAGNSAAAASLNTTYAGRTQQRALARPNKNNFEQIARIAETADLHPFNDVSSCALVNFPTITNQLCFGFLWEARAARKRTLTED